MKKCLYIIPLLFALPLIGVGQNDSIATKKESLSFNNQLDLDVEFLAFSVGYNRRVKKSFFLGINMGLGLASRFFGKKYENEIGVELFHISMPFKYITAHKLQFEIAPKYNLIFFGSVDAGNTAESTIGLDGGIYYGNKIQFGIKISIGYFLNKDSSISNEYINSVSFIILRMPLKW